MVYAINIADPTVNPIAKISSIGTLLNVIIPYVTIFGAVLFLIMIISGGIKWLTAGDSAENVKKAQATLTFAFIGLVIVIAAFLITKILGIIFQINIPI